MAATAGRRRSKLSLSVATKSGGISIFYSPYSESKPEWEGVERRKFVTLFGICVNRVKLDLLAPLTEKKFPRQDSLASL